MNIGIIGGADGPTSIFLSTNFNWYEAVIIASIIAVIIVLFFKKRKS